MRHKPGETPEEWFEVEQHNENERQTAIARGLEHMARQSEALAKMYGQPWPPLPEPEPKRRRTELEKFLEHGLFGCYED